MKKAKVILDFIKNNSDKITMVQINIDSKVNQSMYAKKCDLQRLNSLTRLLVRKIKKLPDHKKIQLLNIINNFLKEEEEEN